MQRSSIKNDLTCQREDLNKFTTLQTTITLIISPNEAFNRIDQEFL
jgi:hypothetical protein